MISLPGSFDPLVRLAPRDSLEKVICQKTLGTPCRRIPAVRAGRVDLVSGKRASRLTDVEHQEELTTSTDTINTKDGARFWGLIRIRRVTAGSQSPGIGRVLRVTKGHEAGRFRIREDDTGVCRTPEDTSPPRFGTVRPRVQIPGPRPLFSPSDDDLGGSAHAL